MNSKKDSELDKFLVSLSDHELSIFVGYRLESFIYESKDKILEEINRRNLSGDDMGSLFSQKLSNKISNNSQICNRCGSDRVFTETDIDYKTIGKYSDTKVAIDTLRCQLCGYNPDKETPKNFLDRIKKYFNNSKEVRILDWEKL